MGNVKKKYSLSSRAEGLEISGSVQRQEVPMSILKTWYAQWRMGQRQNCDTSKGVPCPLLPTTARKSESAARAAVVWAALVMQLFKDDQVSLLHLLKVLLRAAGYSVNQLWIIYFLSICAAVSKEDCTSKDTIFLIQAQCISSDPSWKAFQRIRKYICVCVYTYVFIYIPGFSLLN